MKSVFCLGLFLVLLPCVLGQLSDCTSSGEQTLSADSGTFGCDGYGNNVQYSWYISSPSPRHHLRVTITNLNTQTGDVVTAINGPNASSSFEPFRFSLDGQVDSYTFTSDGPGVVVQFSSNSAATGSGFSASFETFGEFFGPCYDTNGFESFTPDEVLVREFGCGHYANLASKSWLLTAPKENNRILLWFQRFSTEISADVVTVYDGTDSSGAILQTLSGDLSFSGPYQSTSSSVFIQFNADYSIIYDGFMISAVAQGNYTPPAYQCTTDNSYIVSGSNGNFGCNGYANDVTVTWRIDAPQANQRIALNFTQLDTEQFEDIIYIYNGYNRDFVSRSFSGDYTGDNLPSLVSYGPSLFVSFDSDISITYPGFEIHYTAFGDFAPPCWNESLVYTLTEGSQSGCDGYDNNVQTTWKLVGPLGTTVTLEFSEFDTESCCDHLRIYDGASASGSLIEDLSGFHSNISPITSTSNEMFLDFTSDFSVVSSGFVFSWTYN